MKNILFLFAFLCINFYTKGETFIPVAVSSEIDKVQPFTGIVFWHDSEYSETYKDVIQLEFSYMKYSDIVKEKGVYDWTALENVLNKIASRGHHAIIRFYFVYPKDLPERNGTTTVPNYIKNMNGYTDYKGKGDGSECWFPDWRSEELQGFTLEFYTKLAEKYDSDQRLAFIQTGFGLWAEYHTWSGKVTVDGKEYKEEKMVGVTFPSKSFQQEFISHLNNCFRETPWNISIDAADSDYTPFEGNNTLINMNFGLFDDSFMSEEHDEYNKYNWEFFGKNRFKTQPAGGEFNYYSDFDQKNVLNPAGLRGKTWEQCAEEYHISYMIGNDQPEYQPKERIKQASMFAGYKFRLAECLVSELKTMLKFTNNGIAPIYYDAYPEIDGIQSTESLKGLCPGESRTFTINTNKINPDIRIRSPRLLSIQEIQFTADLKPVNDIYLKEKEIVKFAGNQLLLQKEGNVCLYDISGCAMGEWKNTNNIDISFLNKGVYITVVKYEGRELKIKLLKE